MTDDLISRQKTIDALMDTLNDVGVLDSEDINTVFQMLPPIQPEIVRCKDCKYWNSGSCEYPEHAVNCQDYWVGDIETEAEHFCGYADRREMTE